MSRLHRIGMALAVSATMAQALPARAVSPNRNGALVIASVQKSNVSGDIGPGPLWLLTPGGHSARLRAAYSGAQFSPDGRRLAYATGRGIELSRADGTHARRLTRGPDYTPAWAPNNRTLGFVRVGRRGGIYVIRTDGTRLRRLTTNPADELVWSPGGRALAFVAYAATNPTVGLVGLVGRPRELGAGLFVSWTRRGLSYRRGTTLISNRADGTGQRLVTDGLRVLDPARVASEWCPPDYAWSPDAQRVGIVRDERVVVSRPGDASATDLGPASPICPGLLFSPDGQRLAATGAGGTAILPADGTGPRRFRDIPYDGECYCDEWVGSIDWQARRR